MTNNGPLASNGAQVMDPLPAGMSFMSSPDGCVAAGSNVSCAVGALAVNATKTFHVLVQLANPYTGNSPIINTATLDAPGDTNPGNNTGTARTEVPGAPVTRPSRPRLPARSITTATTTALSMRVKRALAA